MCIHLLGCYLFIYFRKQFIYFVFFLFLLQFRTGLFYGKPRDAGKENTEEVPDSWIAPPHATDSDLDIEEEPDSDVDDPSFVPDDDSIEEDFDEPSTSSGIYSRRG